MFKQNIHSSWGKLTIKHAVYSIDDFNLTFQYTYESNTIYKYVTWN